MLDFEKVWMENEELRLLWRVVTFTKCCEFYEKLWLLWKLATFMKNCDFYGKLWLLWKVTTFLKDCDFSKGLWPFRYGTIRTFSHYLLFSINWGISSHFKKNLWTSSSTTKSSILSVLYCRWVVHWHRSFWYLYSGDLDHFIVGGHKPNQISDTRGE